MAFGESRLSGIKIEGLRKVYGDTIALSSLTLEAHPGEILGIAGPNGSGKSTLVKILASEEKPDSGRIFLNGEAWKPGEHRHEVAVVHQEPQLFPNLTVAENILVGIEKTRHVRPKDSEVSRNLLEQVGLSRFSNQELGSLPLALQQRTEIARALARSADVFLFDEPNSALTEDESAELFEWMHRLAQNGSIIILVSHRLSELALHCDRVIIINDGEVKTEILKVELSEERIARELVTIKSKRFESSGSVNSKDFELLKISNWNQKGQIFESIELSVKSGEILAVIGVEGSGGRELVRSFAGYSEASGTVELGGWSGKSAIERVAFVSGDRIYSLFSNFSVGENLYVRLAERISTRARTLSQSRARVIASSAVEQFLVRTSSVDTPIRSLSGGNQQKVAIAAALALEPQMIALEEPTRGVDISSKREIYKLVQEYVEKGHAAVFYCTEVSEVYDAADRVIVISNGKIKKTLDVWSYSDAETLAEAITRSEEIVTPNSELGQ